MVFKVIPIREWKIGVVKKSTLPFGSRTRGGEVEIGKCITLDSLEHFEFFFHV